MYSVDIDALLTKNSEGEEELIKIIKERKAKLAEEAKAKAEEEQKKKDREKKVNVARTNAVKALKFYIETLLDAKMDEKDVKNLTDSLLSVEKRFNTTKDFKSTLDLINFFDLFF